MSYLLIDIGNSYIKYSVYSENILSSVSNIKTSLYEQLIDMITIGNTLTIQKIVLVSVADDILTKNIIVRLSEYFKCSVEQVSTSESSYGVKCGYTDFKLLGADRWVAIVAGYNFQKKQDVIKPVMVVDCGTVITVDVIDSTGQHLGGWMMPGASLMSNSLVNKSAGINLGINKPVRAQSELSHLFGHSTQECVEMGVSYAEVGFIEQCYIHVRNELNEVPRCIFTGGGATDIIPKLTMTLEYLPNLIFDGLVLYSE